MFYFRVVLTLFLFTQLLFFNLTALYAGEGKTIVKTPDIRLPITSDDVACAEINEDVCGRAYLYFKLHEFAAKVLGVVTKENQGKRLAVTLNGEMIITAPIVEEIVGGRISSRTMPEHEARELLKSISKEPCSWNDYPGKYKNHILHHVLEPINVEYVEYIPQGDGYILSIKLADFLTRSMEKNRLEGSDFPDVVYHLKHDGIEYAVIKLSELLDSGGIIRSRVLSEADARRIGAELTDLRWKVEKKPTPATRP